MATHAEFYEDSNAQTALSPDFVVETLGCIMETFKKKMSKEWAL